MQPEATGMDQGAKERERQTTGTIYLKGVLTQHSNGRDIRQPSRV